MEESPVVHLPLPTRNFPDSASIELARRAAPPHAQLDSPARLVMTHLADLGAMTVAPHERLAQAEQRMVQHGVCALLVVARMPHVLGIVTLADLQGGKPLRLVAERRLTHEELCVADLMQAVSQLDAVDDRLLARATVGQVVATLLEFGHPNLLVLEPGADPAAPRIRGLVLQMQVERQLGMRLPSAEIAGTFAEIEQALI
jgi:CBS-domain-containing membrane protein